MRRVFRLVPLLIAFGCAATVPPPTPTPPPPLDVPAPEAGALPEPESAESEAMVEIVLPGEALQRLVDRELPNPIHRENGRRLQAEAERGELKLEPVQGGLLWTLPVELWARAGLGRLSVTCGVDEPRPHVDVTLRTELHIDEEWGLTTRTTPGEREWSRRCQVSFLNIDVTSRIDPHVARAQTQAAEKIDEAASQLDLRTSLDRIWPLLSYPLELEQEGDADTRLRLLVQPEGLRVVNLTPDDTGGLRLRAALRGHFLITSRFVSAPPQALPAPGVEPGPSFVANLELKRPLDELVSALRPALVGTTATVDGETVTIDEVEARLTEAGIALGLRLVGAIRGMVWAIARPVHEVGALRLTHARWTDATLRTLDDEHLAQHLARALFAPLEEWEWWIADATTELREHAMAAVAAFGVPEGVSVELDLAPVDSDGTVFGSGQSLVVRIPTPGTFRVTVDASNVGDGL